MSIPDPTMPGMLWGFGPTPSPVNCHSQALGQLRGHPNCSGPQYWRKTAAPAKRGSVARIEGYVCGAVNVDRPGPTSGTWGICVFLPMKSDQVANCQCRF